MNYVAHLWMSGTVISEISGTEIETELLREYESEAYVRISADNRKTVEAAVRMYQQRGACRNTDSSIQIIASQCYADVQDATNYLALGQAAARHGVVPVFTYGDGYQVRLYATNLATLEKCLAQFECNDVVRQELCSQSWYELALTDMKQTYADDYLAKIWMNSILTSVIEDLDHRAGGCVALSSDSAVLYWKGNTPYLLVPSPADMMDLAQSILERNSEWTVYVDNHKALNSSETESVRWSFSSVANIC